MSLFVEYGGAAPPSIKIVNSAILNSGETYVIQSIGELTAGSIPEDGG